MTGLVPIPVIDIFAGPGGLGEGFSAFKTEAGDHPFRICLSIEKDSWAHKTLRLRSFFRQFDQGNVPEIYYEILRQKTPLESLPEVVKKSQALRQCWKMPTGKLCTQSLEFPRSVPKLPVEYAMP